MTGLGPVHGRSWPQSQNNEATFRARDHNRMFYCMKLLEIETLFWLLSQSPMVREGLDCGILVVKASDTRPLFGP